MKPMPLKTISVASSARLIGPPSDPCTRPKSSSVVGYRYIEFRFISSRASQVFRYSSSSTGIDAPNPDIAVSHSVAVILQLQGIFAGLRNVFGELPVYGGAHYLLMELNQDAVLNHRKKSGPNQLAGCKSRRFEKDIIGLPLAGFPRSVHQRRPLAIDRARLPIRIRGVLVRIEDLNFIAALEKHAAVSTPLAGSRDGRRRGPFQMQLHIAEFFFGGDITGPGDDLHVSILDLPGGRLPL